MKVYTKISLDIDSWEIREEISYDHDGPVAECKGGGGGDSVDPIYNAKMAKIAQQQQDLANEYFEFWRTDQKELERMQINANKELLPQQTALQKQQMTNESEMMGVRSDYERSMMEYGKEDLEARKPLARKFYDQAMSGDDPNAAAAEARAGVGQQIDAGKATMRRDAARMGADVNSSRFQRNLGGATMERAKATAGAMTAARNETKDKNFAKMDTAMSKNLGVG